MRPRPSPSPPRSNSSESSANPPTGPCLPPPSNSATTPPASLPRLCRARTARADFARRNVRCVNREKGSGRRALLDCFLGEHGIPDARLAAYDRVVFGHLAAAYTVSSDEVDCRVATRPAAQAFGLDFVPIQRERYDFVLRRTTLGLPPSSAFLDVLQKTSLRRKLEVLAGYETAQTGMTLA